jgi:TolB-like protein
MSAEGENEYFADGLTEEIINSLAHVPELLVTARTSVFAFKDRNLPVAEIAGALGVAHIVEGSVRRAEGKLRITAQLIRASDGFHLWSKTYDRDFSDIFVIQGVIAKSVTSALELSMLGETAERLDRENTDNFDAYNEYLQAVDSMRQKTTESVQQAVKHAQRAIELDPDFARAHALLGRLYLQSERYGTWPGLDLEERRSRARNAALRALEIAPGLPVGLTILGLLQDDPEVSMELLRQAAESGPNETWVLQEYSQKLVFELRVAEAEELFLKLLKIDPLDEENYWGLVYLQWGRQQVPAALETIAQAKEKIPGSVRALEFEVLSYRFLGDWSSAIGSQLEIVKLDPEDYGAKGWLGALYLQTGMPDEAQRWFDRTDAQAPQSKFEARYNRLIMNAYYQRNDAEVFADAKQLVMDGSGPAHRFFIEYGMRLGKLDEVLTALEELYPNLFIDPPRDLDKTWWGTYATGLALLENGDIQRGAPLIKAHLDEQDKQERTWLVVPASITGRLALGETEAAMEKFRKYAAAKWYWFDPGEHILFRHSRLYDPIRDEPEFIELLDMYDKNAAEQRKLITEVAQELPIK